jgi:hypothetical protein
MLKEAQAQRAAQERKAREEAEAEEQEQREVGEGAKAVSSSCLVPSLKGDSLAKARRVLSKAHCELGKVATPKADRHGKLVIAGQGIRPGRKLPDHTRVGVTMGRMPLHRK